MVRPRRYGSRVEWMTSGADIATMATGLSAVTAAATWLAVRWSARRREKAAAADRNWHGYIPTNGISDWHVLLAEDPREVTARVVLEVIDANGEPDGGRAHDLRETVKRDGMIVRVPNPEEYDFLRFLHKKFGYGKGRPVGYPDYPGE
jgi:hypothetical protein